MNFFANQSLSVNQRRNPRLNEYFAVVGLGEDLLLQAADGLPSPEPRAHTSSPSPAPPRTASTSASESVGEGSISASMSMDVVNSGIDPAEAGDLPPTPFPRLERRRTYGSFELGEDRTSTAGAAGLESPLRAKFRSRVLHRFPLYDHDDSPFPTNLALFCFPGGFKLSTEMMLPRFFTFVHTRANGQHMFGYCLTLYEPLEMQHRAQLQGMMEAHRAKHGGGFFIIPTSVKGGKGDSVAGLSRARAGAVAEARGEVEAGSEEGIGVGMGTADKMEDILEANEPVFAPKCLCLLSCWPYFGPFREWFLNLYRVSLSPSKIPLERYIGNFLLEVPTPTPGGVEVLYNMGPSTIGFSCPPPNKPVAWGSVPFEPLFRCLCHENIALLFSCLLLEGSVLLKSSQFSLLTNCAEVLALLLYPLSWAHVYIPILPESLMGVLGAPLPFLVGVHSSFLDNSAFDLPGHVTLVDLDRDRVELGKSSPVLCMPVKRRAKLVTSLQRYADMSHCRTEVYRETVMEFSDLAFSMAAKPCDFDGVNADSESDLQEPNWDAVRETFLRFFVGILRDYRRFLVYPTKENPNPVQLFMVDAFLDKLDSESRPFVRALCDTQAFQNFVDARIQPEGSDLDVLFFDESIEAKKNRSRLHFIKRDTQFLRSEKYVKAKTVYALTPDTTGLDMDAPATVHTRFPLLSADLYAVPRDIPSLSNRTEDDSVGGGGRGGGGRERGHHFKNSSGGAGLGGTKRLTLRRRFSEEEGGIFRASSRSDEEESAPSTIEEVMCSVFVVAFCATVGLDAGSGKKTLGVTVNNTSTDWADGDSRVYSFSNKDGVAEMESDQPEDARALVAQQGTSLDLNNSNSSSLGSHPEKEQNRRDDGAKGDGHTDVRRMGEVKDVTLSSALGGVMCETEKGGVGLVEHHQVPSGEQQEGSLVSGDDEPPDEGPELGSTLQVVELSTPAATVVTEETAQSNSIPSCQLHKDDNGVDTVEGGAEVKSGDNEEVGTVSAEEAEERSNPVLMDKVNSRKVKKSPAFWTPKKLANFGELKLDLKEERLYAANGALMVALEVLELMHKKGLAAEEVVYRSLISACGRCGNSDKAMVVVEMMMSTGIMPDAMVSRCLVDAFAMDENFGAAHPFSLLDWSKFESSKPDRRTTEPKNKKGGGEKFSLRRMMKTFTSTEGHSLSPPKLRMPRRQGSTRARQSSVSGVKGAIVVPSPPSVTDTAPLGWSSHSENNWGLSVGTETVVQDPTDADSSAQCAPHALGLVIESEAVDGGEVKQGGKYMVDEIGSRTGEEVSEDDGIQSRSLMLQMTSSASVYSPSGTVDGISLMMQQQVILGERMLERLYPGLEINTEGETCPKCHRVLSSETIQAGWEPDPNDYTTMCPGTVIAKGRKDGGSKGSPYSNVDHESAVGGDGVKGGSAGNGDQDLSEPAVSTSGRPVSSSVAGMWHLRVGNGKDSGENRRERTPCRRRFVARFSVACSDPNWEGSTGKGTPLWCEYLPPWVLQKEVHTILASYGVEFLCSPVFRQRNSTGAAATPATGTAPPDVRGIRLGRGTDGSPSSNRDPRSDANPTIFWNLIVHFRRHSLPFAFLLAGPSSAGRVHALFL